MNRHLSSQEMSEWTLGERNAGTERHVRDCASCRAKLSQASETLEVFRESARHWSEEQAGAGAPDFWKAKSAHPWITFRGLSWALASLVIVVVAGVSVGLRGNRPGVADSTVEDVALLKQVDGGVSQAVPRSLEPLLQLVSLEESVSSPAAARESVKKEAREQ